jgi:hypothetical protein
VSLASGDKLGPYEILALIGAGGMGEVYRARDTRLDRIVAIKRLKGPYSARFFSSSPWMSPIRKVRIFGRGGILKGSIAR